MRYKTLTELLDTVPVERVKLFWLLVDVLRKAPLGYSQDESIRKAHQILFKEQYPA